MSDPRPKDLSERLSDSAFFEMCGLRWPEDIEEIDFSVPGEPGADLYLPGTNPEPDGSVQRAELYQVMADFFKADLSTTEPSVRSPPTRI